MTSFKKKKLATDVHVIFYPTVIYYLNDLCTALIAST